jgi:amino acid transporter
VARAERVIVAVKIAFLVLLVAVGVAGVSTERLAPAQWSSPVSVIAGGMITFLAYEGFELIANTAEDVADTTRVLTRARNPRRFLRLLVASAVRFFQERQAGNAIDLTEGEAGDHYLPHCTKHG